MEELIHKSDISESPFTYEKYIMGISLMTAEEAENLPEDIRDCGEYYWLKDKGDYSDDVAYVNDVGCVNYAGYGPAHDDFFVRPVLLTNIDLKLYNIYKIFDIDWYYIGEGKFLAVKPIGEYRFNDDPYYWSLAQNKILYSEYLGLCENADITNYEKSEVKKYLENWLEERE